MALSTDSKTALSYMRKKVRAKTWKVGDRIENKTTLASKIGVSRYSVNSAVKTLVVEGILEDHGHGGLWVVGGVPTNKSGLMRKLSRLGDVKRQLKAAKLLGAGGILIPSEQLIIWSEDSRVNVFFPMTGEESSFEKIDVQLTARSPISMEEAAVSVSKDLVRRYILQQEILKYLPYLRLHKVAMGLHM